MKGRLSIVKWAVELASNEILLVRIDIGVVLRRQGTGLNWWGRISLASTASSDQRVRYLASRLYRRVPSATSNSLSGSRFEKNLECGDLSPPFLWKKCAKSQFTSLRHPLSMRSHTNMRQTITKV